MGGTMKTPKTVEVRAAELFRLVHGPGDGGSEFAFNAMNPGVREGWLKLGKLVLRLESRIAPKAKGAKSLSDIKQNAATFRRSKISKID